MAVHIHSLCFQAAGSLVRRKSGKLCTLAETAKGCCKVRCSIVTNLHMNFVTITTLSNTVF